MQTDSEPRQISVIAFTERKGRPPMDFGFGSLVDKFEERIGRKATNVLLWLAAIALFVTCTRAVLLDGVIPLLEFVRGGDEKSARSMLWTAGWAIVIGIVAGSIFGAVMRFLVKRMMAQAVEASNRASDLIDEARRVVDEARARSDELDRRTASMIEETEQNTGVVKAERGETP